MEILNQEYELVALDRLKCHPANPRRGDLAAIGESITENGFYGAVVAQRSTGYILAGNHRWKHAQAVKAPSIPVTWVDVDDDRALRILLADNRTNDLAGYDNETLVGLLESLDSFDGTGYDQAALDELLASLETSLDPVSSGNGDGKNKTLSDRFVVPPFSVLDARQGYWQDRRRAWLALGIKSEIGRGGGVTWGESPEVTEKGLNYYSREARASAATSPGGSPRPACDYSKRQRGDGAGKPLKKT